jgi:hypothetical protein
MQPRNPTIEDTHAEQRTALSRTNKLEKICREEFNEQYRLKEFRLEAS